MHHRVLPVFDRLKTSEYADKAHPTYFESAMDIKKFAHFNPGSIPRSSTFLRFFAFGNQPKRNGEPDINVFAAYGKVRQ